MKNVAHAEKLQLQFFSREGIPSSLGLALAGVAEWIERWPASQRVAGFDSRLGHMPGLQATSPVGGTRGTTTH